MFNLIRSEERQFNFAMRNRRKSVESTKLAMSLILESVHPSYFKVLPPAPRLLINLAVNRGLLKLDEVAKVS